MKAKLSFAEDEDEDGDGGGDRDHTDTAEADAAPAQPVAAAGGAGFITAAQPGAGSDREPSGQGLKTGKLGARLPIPQLLGALGTAGRVMLFAWVQPCIARLGFCWPLSQGRGAVCC